MSRSTGFFRIFIVLLCSSTAWAAPSCNSNVTGATAACAVTTVNPGTMVVLSGNASNFGLSTFPSTVSTSGTGCPTSWHGPYFMAFYEGVVFYGVTPSSGTCTASVTWPGSPTAVATIAYEDPNILQAYALDGILISTGSSSSPSSSTIQTDGSSDVIISTFVNGSASAITPGSGFSTIQFSQLLVLGTGVNSVGMMVKTGVAAGSTTNAVSWSAGAGGSNNTAAGQIAFRTVQPTFGQLQTFCQSQTGTVLNFTFPDPVGSHDAIIIDQQADNGQDNISTDNPVWTDDAGDAVSAAPVGLAGQNFLRFIPLIKDVTGGNRTFTATSATSQTVIACLTDMTNNGARLYLWNAFMTGANTGSVIGPTNITLPSGAWALYSSVSDPKDNNFTFYTASPTTWVNRWNDDAALNGGKPPLEMMHSVWTQNVSGAGTYSNTVTSSTTVANISLVPILAFGATQNPYARVKQVGNAGAPLSGSSPGFKTIVPVSAGDIAYACVMQTSVGSGTMTSSVAGTWVTLDGGGVGDYYWHGYILYTGSGIDTFQWHNASGNNASIAYREFLGAQNLDLHHAAQGSSVTSINDGGITTANANEYIAACGGVSQQQDIHLASGNVTDFRVNLASHQTEGIGYEVAAGAAATYSDTYGTTGSATGMAAMIAAFTSAPAPPSTVQPVVNLITLNKQTLDALTQEVLGYE